LCGLLGRTAQALRPLERLIHQRVLASAVINADETEVRMLKPGHGKAITGYLSGYAGDADHRFVFYDFRPSRSRDGPQEMLADYRGYLQTDGYVVYTSLVRHSAGRLVDVACWAHGRRGFEEAIPATSNPLVHEAMIWTQQLYDIEDREQGMSAANRRTRRRWRANYWTLVFPARCILPRRRVFISTRANAPRLSSIPTTNPGPAAS